MSTAAHEAVEMVATKVDLTAGCLVVLMAAQWVGQRVDWMDPTLVARTATLLDMHLVAQSVEQMAVWWVASRVVWSAEMKAALMAGH